MVRLLARFVTDAIKDHPHVAFGTLLLVFVSRTYDLGDFDVIVQLIVVGSVLAILEVSWSSIFAFGVLVFFAGAIAASLSEAVSEGLGEVAYFFILIALVFAVFDRIRPGQEDPSDSALR